ncbi:MAG: asparagine--tRNA ligase [Pseudomonadota bacterium]
MTDNTPQSTTIRALLTHELPLGSPVEVQGWVRSRRTSKGGFSFVHLHDGSCFDTIQAVANGDLPGYEDTVLNLGTGCSVRVRGTLVESQGKGQDREIQADAIDVVGWVDDPESYPIAKKRHSFEYLRTVAHLRPRTNTFGAMARMRNSLSHAIHDFFHRDGFVWINTPIITASDCEGAGELFRVSTLDRVNQQADYAEDFFGKETFLTVSGQLNLESYCCAMGKVYSFGPTFRAENSNTSRHLAEFWMVEPEIAFADLSDLADLAERFLKALVGVAQSERADDLAFFTAQIDAEATERLAALAESQFVRMSYTEAVKILKDSGQSFEFPVEWGMDLQSEHERFLCEQYVKAPIVVTDYPKDIKAFYMRLNDDEKTVAAMDVLVPGVGEIIGGSQREERLDVLDARMGPELLEELGWYRDLRRYGTVPHAGFGLGLERLLLYLTGMDNIRDAIPFPRVPNSAPF